MGPRQGRTQNVYLADGTWTQGKSSAGEVASRLCRGYGVSKAAPGLSVETELATCQVLGHALPPPPSLLPSLLPAPPFPLCHPASSPGLVLSLGCAQPPPASVPASLHGFFIDLAHASSFFQLPFLVSLLI